QDNESGVADGRGAGSAAAPERALAARGPVKLSFETRVLALALGAGLPGTLMALVLLVINDYPARVVWTFAVLVTGVWFGFAFVLRDRVVRPLQTLSNMLAALLEGDYSIRSRGATANDALGLAMLEVNALGETLREQRLGALEATALLRKVMEEIDVAVFAFDANLKLSLVNRAGERLLDMPAERMTGRTAEALGLDALLEGDDQRIIDAAFPGAGG